MAAAAKSAASVIEIKPIEMSTIRVPIRGETPLIMHAWSEKAKTIMLEAQQGVKRHREVRDPAADYEASFYRTASGAYGFPTLGFKAATVGAARYYSKQLKMTELRQWMWFVWDEISADQSVGLTVIEGEPRMREDMVTVGMGTDLRYRPEFLSWTATLTIRYVTSALSRGTILALVDGGGQGVGVGDWRVEKKGDHGMYVVDESRDVEVVK